MAAGGTSVCDGVTFTLSSAPEDSSVSAAVSVRHVPVLKSDKVNTVL